MTDVVVALSLGHARPHREHRLRAIERLHLGLLVEAEDDRAFGGIHVEADDVDQLLLEVGIVRDLEALGPPRAQLVISPDASDGVLADAEALSAKVRVVQCVEVSSGLSCIVTRTISATVPSGSQDLRPLPFSMRPTPDTPSASKRRRHDRTLLEETRTRRAIS